MVLFKVLNSAVPKAEKKHTPNLPTTIVDFRGFDSKHNIISKGWNSHAQREFPGKLVELMLVGGLGVQNS